MNQPTATSVSNQQGNVHSIANSFENPDWYLKGYATNIRVRSETVISLLGEKDFKHVLDIGCGDGSLSLPLLPRTARVTYLDISSAMLDIVKQRIGPTHATKANYLNAGFMEADVSGQSFDLIIGIGVLAYIENVDAFLTKVHSVLAPGGRLLLECTDAAHFLSRLDRGYQAVTGLLRPRKFEIYQHTAIEVVQATAAHGLTLEKTFRYAYSLPVFSRFVSKPTVYKLIRSTYGDINRNQRSSLGNQCLFSLYRST